jgi:hypothetical protein
MFALVLLTLLVLEHRGVADAASGPPRNLIAASVLQHTIDTMWRWSPTFKAQCARLGATSLVRVEIRFGGESHRLNRRAWTRITRGAGGTTKVDIVLELHAVAERVELIAHELEHVIEQLDEVELAASERHGVHETGAGVFETARALHIGLKVRREVDEAGQGRGASAAELEHR